MNIVEQGDIYFLYRPARGTTDVAGLPDVQRFYVVLKPEPGHPARLLVVGQKKLPEAHHEGTRYWGFVDRVVDDVGDLAADLGLTDLGEDQARPVGEGRYAVVDHDGHTDLAYVLEVPEEPGRAQEAFHIEHEATYVLSVKNPEAQGPRGVGLEREQKAEYPPEVMARFGDRRWVSADPMDVLNFEGAEFLLISGTEDVPEDLEEALDVHHESEDTADVLRDLRFGDRQGLVKPLFQGEWR